MAVAQRPEVLLATDNKTVLLSLERDGKILCKVSRLGGEQGDTSGRGIGDPGRGRALVHHQANG
jgi:hypothetical protein